MGKNSKIAWTDHTFNPWWGCTKVSEGCKHCYAETFSNRYGGNYWGLEAERRFFGDKHWNQPLKWNRKAEEEGIRPKVFCGSMCDFLEHRIDLVEAQEKLSDLVEQTPWLDWLMLTKRIENAFIMPWIKDGFPDNVWMGVTVENADHYRRIHRLLNIQAKVRWLSIEPMLGPIDLVDAAYTYKNKNAEGLTFLGLCALLNWVIVGGESGTGARPMNLDWARSVRDQCQDADVPFFMKQIGGHPNKRKEMEDFPEDLRIREFPDMAKMHNE